MKICNVVISNFYKEGYGYQENVLPQMQMLDGHDVFILTCHDNGFPAPSEYINDRGVRVVVLRKNKSILLRIPVLTAAIDKSIGLYDRLIAEAPDVIFAHGIYAHDYRWIIKYKRRNPSVKVFVDNHADYYNNKRYNSIAGVLTRFFFSKPIINRMIPLVEKFWGVTPWRVKYLREVFGIPEDKSDLLIMGGDESLIDWERRDQIHYEIRNKYSIPQDAFLIISGGKIDRAKNIDKLIEAVVELNNSNVYLALFGSVENDMNYLNSYHNKQINLLGWVPADEAYSLFLAADLGFFPGTHSVLWEQACACGLPCVFKDWDGGFNHVDRGGNCILLANPTKSNIRALLESLINNSDNYSLMRTQAIEVREYFSYKEIARRSIQ